MRAPIPCGRRFPPSPLLRWPAAASPCSAIWVSSATSPRPAIAAWGPIQRVVCVGELAAFIAEGAAAAGMDAARISRAATVADVLEELDTLLEPGDAVLVKASHFMGLTRVVEGLVH